MSAPSDSALAALQAKSWRKWGQFSLGIALGCAFLVLLLKSIDPAEVWSLLSRASLLPLLLALAAYGLDFVLRAFRFWLLLRCQRHQALEFGPTISPFIASFGISDVLPFRVGDVFRIIWFNRNFGLPVGDLVGAMVVERLLDLVSILIVAGFALSLMTEAIAPEVVPQLQLGLGLVTGACLLVLLSPKTLDLVAGWIERRFSSKPARSMADLAASVAAAIRSIGRVRNMCWLLPMSVALWLLESIVMFGAWVSLGQDTGDWVQPLVAFAFSTLGTLVPALPGNFGTYEYFGVSSFRAVGVDEPLAAATILLAHMILWLPTALFGIGWLMVARPMTRRGSGKRLEHS